MPKLRTELKLWPLLTRKTHVNSPLTTIVLCLGIALVICFIFRFIFASKRDLWFARTASTVFNQRGFLGSYLALGYPKTWQGTLVTLSELILIVLACAAVLYLSSAQPS